MAFDPKKHLIKVQNGRNYLPVSARLIWFREEHPDWGIETEAVVIDTERQYAIFRCRVYNEGGKLMATGTKMENIKGFGDYLEKAETGSIGRALALCGYGTQFSPDFDEVAGQRLADSPQPVGGRRYGGESYGNGAGRYPNAGQGPRSGHSSGNGNYASSNHASSNHPPASSNHPPMSAPSALSNEEDFERLVGAENFADDDDDPFDETRAPSSAQAVDTSAHAAALGDIAAAAACAACGKNLTKAQQELSIRNYGQALCPSCQKDKSRAHA